MAMVRLDAFIFGYRNGTVAPSDVPKLTNALLKLGISSDVSSDGSFLLRERDVASFCRYADGRLRYDLSGREGLPGAFFCVMKRRGLVLAAFITLALRILLGGIVWDVRIEGNERLDDTTVREHLAANGFGIGDVWRLVDKNEVETAILAECADISWIAINRRGVVAYVRIMETENVGKENEEVPEFSNIIADRDAVIQEITVERGVAAVKVGDVVRRGDVLISGVVETEDGTVFCRAMGHVIGQAVTTVSAEIPRNGTERRKIGDSLREIRLNLFKIPINIFKNYRICLNEYDIIENDKEYALFGKHPLPIIFTEVRLVEYEKYPIVYTEDQMIRMAKDRLDDTVRSEFFTADILKMRSYGEFSEECYTLFTEIVYLTDISKESAIQVS